MRSPLACVLSLAVATALSGCGSSSASKPADAGHDALAATDVLVANDVVNPNPGLDAAQPDVAADMAVVPDVVSNPGTDATEAETTGDTRVAVDVPNLNGGLDAPVADVAADGGAGDGGDGGAGDGGDSGGGDGGPSTACSSLVNPLYIMSGDTQVPVLKTLGKALRQNAANPITLVWYATGSCTIIDSLYNNIPLTQIPSYIPDDPNWDPSAGAVPSCALESGGRNVDIGIPIVFPAACANATPQPASLGAFKGPVQSMLFVVPKAASAVAISSEEAALIFKNGAAANIAPWTDENYYFIRTPTKGVEVSLGALIQVLPAQWHGKQINASNDVVTDVSTSAQPDKTIGILGSETYDTAANRKILKSLAFQAVNQTNGYLPDSTAVAFDKRSLREGHYVAWAHVFYLTRVWPDDRDAGAPGPINAKAKLFIDILTNTANPGIPSGLDPINLVAQKGIVPLCAMTVTRSTEGGPLSLFAPPDPCGCYYESKLSTAAVPASCVTCTTSASCTGGASCRHGYCEADDGRTSLSDCGALASGATHAQIINNTCTAGARFQADHIPTP
jgi:hypothetical protein